MRPIRRSAEPDQFVNRVEVMVILLFVNGPMLARQAAAQSLSIPQKCLKSGALESADG